MKPKIPGHLRKKILAQVKVCMQLEADMKFSRYVIRLMKEMSRYD